MYQTDYDRDLDRLTLLQAQKAEAYDRYLNTLLDWYAQQEAAYQQYRDSVADSQWQQSFNHKKAQDALAHEKWLEELAYSKEQDAAQAAAADPYAVTDYYQEAIEAELRGNRAVAEAALAKRAAKMSSPDYRGNGGTSMEEAYAYIESLLAGTAKQEAEEYLRTNHYTEEENGGLLSESPWNHRRDNYIRTGSGALEVTEYPTYEDYVKAYIEYLSEQ